MCFAIFVVGDGGERRGHEMDRKQKHLFEIDSDLAGTL